MFDMADEEFIVEYVVDKRIGRKGKVSKSAELVVTRNYLSRIVHKILHIIAQVEYLLKWVGYREDDNTWEPAEHLECVDLIEQFERKRKDAKVRPGDKRKAETEKTKKKDGKAKGQGLRGFARKLEAERIVGATDSTGELMYLIKVCIQIFQVQLSTPPPHVSESFRIHVLGSLIFSSLVEKL